MYDVDDACNDDGTCECEEAPTVVLIVFLSAQLKLLFRISRSHHSHTQLTWDMHALAGEGRAWTARRRRSGARGRREAYTVFVAPFCALHWPRLCNPHTIQRLGRRNAANNSDFTPSIAPSHIGRRRKPTLARDGRGVAHHGHGVRTRTWEKWHRLLERLRNGATATLCAPYDAFS